MRTQEEIRIISEEIRINVQQAIVEEERTKAIKKAVDLIKTHQPEIMTGMGIVSTVSMVSGAFDMRAKLLRAEMDQVKMKKALYEYRQRVEERL
jgi:UDP-N-acetylmuramyl tripeptide synthase